MVGLANYEARSLHRRAKGHPVVSTVGRGNDWLVKPKWLPPTWFDRPGKKRRFMSK